MTASAEPAPASFVVTQPAATLQLSGIQTSSITATAATISWATNVPASDQVQYGKTTAYGLSTTVSATMTTTHSWRVNALVRITTYHYRVLSQDGLGHLVVSGDFTFKTSPHKP